MISLDAVADADVDFLLSLPNFYAFSKQGTLVRDVDSVFISNTYPVHTSIITGMYPYKHGIIENVFTQPGKKRPDWRRFYKDIKAKTLYDMASKEGLSVCSIFYPVTCGAKIKWNIPEIPDEMSISRRIVDTLKNGSPGFIINSIFSQKKYLKSIDAAYLDDFLTHIAISAMIKHKPNLLLLHLLDSDSQKHYYGPNSDQAKEALVRLDLRLGQLMDTANKIWDKDEVAFIIFSDHGCLQVDRAVDPNDDLGEFGFINNQAQTKEDYEAFFHNAEGTTFLKIYRHEKTDEIMKAVDYILKKPYAKRLLTKEEMRISGLDQEFVCGIEANDGYCFGKAYKGQHGYSLKRDGYHPFYLAVGDGVEKDRVLNGGCVIDICPLAANLLGIPRWEMDGINRII